MTAPAPADLRVGVDLVAVEEVAASVDRFGDRYVHRIFTPHEIACCRRPSGHGTVARYSTESLAARFAAKEAVIKVLRPVGAQPDWRSIELHRTPGGWCEIRLSGAAEALAVAAGIDELSVSLSHETTMAAAVVVGWSTTTGQGSPMTVDETIRQVLVDHGRLAVPVESLADDTDLFGAGMTSHASVNVMLALEDAFDFEFPEKMLKKSTFESIAAIRAGVARDGGRVTGR